MKLTERFKDGDTQVYADGEQIFTPGPRPKYAWLILDGRVHQYDIKPSGETVTLNVYAKGAVLSLLWLLNDVENRYFFEALGRVKLQKIPAESYRKHLKENPDEMYQLLCRLASGFDGIFSRVAVNSHNDARLRIINELRLEQMRFGSIRLSVKELTARTGLARETVSRTLAKLQRENFLTKEGKNISLL